MKDQINRTNFDKVCRLCLETSYLIPIFDSENISEGVSRYFKEFNESVPEIIASLIGIEIVPLDGLPTGICSKCENSLIASNIFRRQCLKSNDSLQKLKIKQECEDRGEDNSDMTVNGPHYSTSNSDFTVDRIKEETLEDITDHDSESLQTDSSLYDSVWNSSQPQHNYSSSIEKSAVSLIDSTSAIARHERTGASESKMCIICGTIVKRLKKHVTRSHLTSNDRIRHIDYDSTRDCQSLPPVIEDDNADFIMCRMFIKNTTKRQYVKVEFSNHICFMDFVKAASEKFTFAIDLFDYFVDQESFKIDNNDFLNVIMDNVNQSGFAVGVTLRKDGEIVLSSTPSNTNQQIAATQPQILANRTIKAADLKEYLIKHKGAHILQEYKEKSMLCDKSRRHLINAAVDFLEENFGIYPKRMHKEAVAHGIIELFPIYKTKNSSVGGIDLFLNGQTGYLNVRLKNLQSKRRLEDVNGEGSSVKKSKIIPEEDEHEESVIENNVNIEDDLNFLRTAMAPNQNDEIKSKLKSTLKIRNKLTVNKPSVNVRISFPFFFMDPSLISFDYNLRFSHFDENLSQVIVAIQTNVFQILQSLKFEDNVNEYSGWPHIIQCFLCLLKLLPPTATGKYSKSRQTFQQRVNSFILFTKDRVSEITIFNNNNPFIVAFGPNRAAIEKFYVVVDGYLIDLPQEWSFIHVFDLFFKVHFVFNLSYNENLRTFLRFFEKFAYNHASTKITNRMQEISTRLFYHQRN